MSSNATALSSLHLAFTWRSSLCIHKTSGHLHNAIGVDG